MSKIIYAYVLSCCHFVDFQGSKESVVLAYQISLISLEKYRDTFPGKRGNNFII